MSKLSIRETKLPYAKQWIDQDDIDAVVEVLKSDFLTSGPKINEFEQAIADTVGAKYAVAVSNGTAALHVACHAAGFKTNDEVITSPMTFAASANCVLYTGAKPVFADIDSKTYNIDPEDIIRKITKRTKGIIAVHYAGHPAQMDAISDIAKKYGLVVIEDGAHALGSSYNSKTIGGISDLTTFSFHPVKHITTGEGGIITTNDKSLYEKMVLFRSHGITREIDRLNKYDGPWYYEQLSLGFNYRMTDIQAALGISQLKKLKFFIKRRQKIADMYNKGLASVEGIITPHTMENVEHAWHIYVIRVTGMKRSDFVEKMLSRNISVNVHYIPVYNHPYYKELGYEKGQCKNAEEIFEQLVTLPLYPAMEECDVEYVIDNVKDILDSYRKEENQ